MTAPSLTELALRVLRDINSGPTRSSSMDSIWKFTKRSSVELFENSCVPCAESGVCAGEFSDDAASSGSIVLFSSRRLVRVNNRLALVRVARGYSRCA